MSGELLAVHDTGAIAGRFLEDLRGQRSFVYDDRWWDDPDAFALSLSMPRTAPRLHGKRIDAWLWGLLPDNEVVLDRWAKTFQTSARNPFRLLRHVGEECAGAFQLVTPERLEAFETDPGTIDWLDEPDVARRLATVRQDPSRTRKFDDRGLFSLAGAQPKIALYRDGDRWGIPSGRLPTTHILKPPTGDLEGLAENEHFCLRLASVLGLPTTRSEVRSFGAEKCIVVERFDRASVEIAAGGESSRASRATWRLHQEDLCQALGVHPARKYQDEGGPSAAAIAEVLRVSSREWREDVLTFGDALALNWVIGGTDGHSKNYALLHGARGDVRLAPLYDIASVLPYSGFDHRRLKLAMSIGGEAPLRAIAGRHFRRHAKLLGIDADEIVERARSIALRAPDAAATVAREMLDEGLRDPIVSRLVDAIGARAPTCAAALDDVSAPSQ